MRLSGVLRGGACWLNHRDSCARGRTAQAQGVPADVGGHLRSVSGGRSFAARWRIRLAMVPGGLRVPTSTRQCRLSGSLTHGLVARSMVSLGHRPIQAQALRRARLAVRVNESQDWLAVRGRIRIPNESIDDIGIPLPSRRIETASAVVMPRIEVDSSNLIRPLIGRRGNVWLLGRGGRPVVLRPSTGQRFWLREHGGYLIQDRHGQIWSVLAASRRH